jgi:DNA replication protein DnaC
MRQEYADPRELITDSVIDELGKHYGGLDVDVSDSGISLSGAEQADIKRARLDLEFYLRNPDLPLENLCCRLDNYEPRTESQRELLEYAALLLELERTATAGLFMWGNPGVGKTHIATALTKEFMSRKQEAYFLSGEEFRLPVALGPEQVWIIDDLNSAFGTRMEKYREIVLNAHNRGGRVFVTSNTPYESLMDSAFAIHPEERARYMDRTRNMFKVIEVTGPSQREATAWHRSPQSLH